MTLNVAQTLGLQIHEFVLVEFNTAHPISRCIVRISFHFISLMKERDIEYVDIGTGKGCSSLEMLDKFWCIFIRCEIKFKPIIRALYICVNLEGA